MSTETMAATVLREFVQESNRIEGIVREPTDGEIAAHEEMLARPQMLVAYLEHFVRAVAHAPLRDGPGMDVRVGSHFPPLGGPDVRVALGILCGRINSFGWHLTPYEVHLQYETLHPFMDGNGRSGRALWAWMMFREGRDPFALPFLHRWYYESLNNGAEVVTAPRGRTSAPSRPGKAVEGRA